MTSNCQFFSPLSLRSTSPWFSPAGPFDSYFPWFHHWTQRPSVYFTESSEDDESPTNERKKKRRKILGEEFGSIDINSEEGRKLLKRKSAHVGAVREVSDVIIVLVTEVVTTWTSQHRSTPAPFTSPKFKIIVSLFLRPQRRWKKDISMNWKRKSS